MAVSREKAATSARRLMELWEPRWIPRVRRGKSTTRLVDLCIFLKMQADQIRDLSEAFLADSRNTQEVAHLPERLLLPFNDYALCQNRPYSR
jgi:hypothetical protein